MAACPLYCFFSQTEMDSFSKKLVIRGKEPFSAEEEEVFFVVQKFLQGIAQKDKLLLEESLDDNARIELRWQKRGEVVGKENYIRIVTGDSPFYKRDFQFLDATIEMHENWALTRGIFMFCDEPFSSSLLWIKLIKKSGKWLVISNRFGFLDFQPETIQV